MQVYLNSGKSSVKRTQKHSLKKYFMAADHIINHWRVEKGTVETIVSRNSTDSTFHFSPLLSSN